jgi:hypothetical protein
MYEKNNATIARKKMWDIVWENKLKYSNSEHKIDRDKFFGPQKVSSFNIDFPFWV